MRLYKGFRSLLSCGLHKNLFRTSSRNPRDLDLSIHAIADIWFFREFGIHARSSCLICSTDIEQARAYAGPTGSVMLISPVSPCKIIYAKKVRDMYSITDACPNPLDAGPINNWLAAMGYECVDSPYLISSEHFGEVMIDCESFVATNLGSGLAA